MSDMPSQALTQQTADDFLRISTAFYRSPMASEYLLELQNSQQKNVNELLFALWASEEYKVCFSPNSVERINWAAERSKKWAENIRNTRFELEAQWQPPYPEKIRSARDAMLETELKIEHLHQQKLVESLLQEKFNTSEIQKLDEETIHMSNLTVFCGEPATEADYLQLIMLWQEFLKSQKK